MNKIFKPLLITIIILIAAVLLIPAIFKNIKYGLDLQGGFEVLYKVESIDGKEVTTDMVTNTYKTIMKRIDVLGVSEPSITVEGEDRIRVQLAGVTNPDEARKTLSQVASLTFRDSSDNLLMTSDVLKQGGAKVGQDSNARPAVSLSVKDKTKFYNVTKKISKTSDQTIVIWLDFEEGEDSFAKERNNCGSLNDSKCLSAASVEEGFASDVIIRGNFTTEEVKNLVELINSGSLQTKLTEISSKTVSASFGQNSLNNTLFAGIVGLIVVTAFMILVYHFSGFVSAVGLVVYTLLTFLIFWLIGGVLTLPGIAAMLLGIGMAVDANVINFAKIKDELKEGKSFKEAYKLGNKSSFMTIMDANVTTFIAAIILFIFGESTVKGFATMLIISIIVTLLIMVGFTRILLNSFVKTGYFDDKINLFLDVNPKKLNKDSKFKIKCSFKSIIISIILVGAGIVALMTSGLNLGIDFKGGSSINLQGTQITEEKLNKDLKELGYTLNSYEYVDETNSIIVTDTLDEAGVLKTKNYFENKYVVNADIGVVSNVVKQELVRNAIYSLILAVIGIIIYVSIRYTFKYAVSAIIALLHDAFVIVAIFAILLCGCTQTPEEVNTIFIAAILSIIGYSINDTIVLFDRIRDEKKIKYKNKINSKEELNNLLNDSINKNLFRNIITSFTTIIPIVCLILLGSKEILNFNIAMFVGVLIGSYSSFFLATYILKKLEYKWIGKEEKKWYDELDEKEEIKVKGINC